MQTKDINFFINCFDNLNSNLTKTAVLNMIMSTKDMEIINYFIENHKKYDINPYFIRRLAESTQNPEYIKKCIKDRENYNFSDVDIFWMVVSIEDKQFVKDFIKNGEEYGIGKDYIREMAITIRDEEIKSVIKTKDKEIIDRYIKNKDKNELNEYDMIDMIIETQDNDYIKSYIENEGKNVIDKKYIIYMAILSENKEIVKYFIDNKKQYDVSRDDIATMIIATKDKDYIEECFFNGDFGEYKLTRRINLPNGMKFGIEIESEGDNSKYINEELSNIVADGWIFDEDGSLNDNGIETISPPMENGQLAMKDINKVCTILNACKRIATERCAGHIHINAKYLTSVQAYKNLTEIWYNSEKILYIISNEKGTIPRKKVVNYAPPISENIENTINGGEIDLQSEENLKEFIKILKELQRY